MIAWRGRILGSGMTRPTAAAAPARWPHLAVVLAGLLSCLSGCAALTNPVADGIPVHRLPPEVLGQPREEEIPIPLTALRQPPPDSYRLDVGDVLGIWIEGVLGNRDQPPPVSVPSGTNTSNLPPSIGFPIPVREDGTISLPFIDPVPVKGLTTGEVQAELRKAYTVTRKILQPDRERILVDVQRPRLYHILVIRQDSGGLTVGANGLLGNTKRGTGYQLDLPAYENDVLNALAQTGGFPGLDAKDEIVIERGAGKGARPAHVMIDTLEGGAKSYPGWGGGEQLRVPLRQRRDQPLPFKPEDVILNTGDVLYIDSRDTEVYYTGGILPPQQFVLPRDFDIDVVEAIAIARGPLVSGGISSQFGFGASSAIPSGLGGPSPSNVTVLRRLPNGEQITIKVDLNKALRDPRERVLIQPKDFIFLQETVDEAIARYWTSIFQINFFGTLFERRDGIATTTINAP